MAERDAAAAQSERHSMRGPHRFVVRMVLFLVLVAGLAVMLGGPLLAAFMGNPGVNGVILGILFAGIIYIFRQVLLLRPASDWIDSFRERLADRDLTAPPGPTPRLLGPLARMLGRRQSGRGSLAAVPVDRAATRSLTPISRKSTIRRSAAPPELPILMAMIPGTEPRLSPGGSLT